MKRDLFFCLLLNLVVLLFLNRGARMEGVFFGADEIASDLLHFSYPYREFWATDYLKAGKVPLWNPYVGSGLPILAEAQTGIFYPVSLILYKFFPPPVAFNWLIISSYILVGIGTFFYTRKIGVKDYAAFFSAAIFTLSGFMVSRLRHVPIITAVAFMPWMFLALEGILTQKSYKWTVLLAVFTACSIFAGHYSSTFMVLLVMFIYFMLRLRKVFQAKNSESMTPVVLFISGVFLGVLLTAIQLIPSLELINLSTRFNVAATTENLWSTTFLWKYLLFFINPYIIGDPSRATWNMQTGNYWENMGYLGIVPLILILTALIGFAGKRIQASFAIKAGLIITLILTLGSLTPVYKIFMDFIPGFSFTRIPGRFLLFVDFFGAVIAGISLQSLAERFTAGKKSVVIISITVLAVVDLFYFGYPFNTVMPVSYFNKPESVKTLEADSDLFRVLSPDLMSWETAWNKAGGWRGDLTPYIGQRELLPPDLNLLFRIPSPSIIYELTGHFSVKRSGELDNLLIHSFSEGAPKNVAENLLGMANVKYILSSKELNNFSGIDLVSKYDTKPGFLPIYIYQNKSFLPRAYFVGRGENFSKTQELLIKMLQEEFAPDKEVLLEEDIEVFKTNGRAKVNIESYQDTKIMIDIEAKDAGYLVLSDTYYPGWKAYVDGKETNIYRANYAFRAVKVTSGNHKIDFVYKPLSFKAGGYISLGALIITAGICLWTVKKSKLL